MMGALLIAHLVIGTVAIAAGEVLGRRTLWLASLPPLATLCALATWLPRILDGGVVEERFEWVPALGLAFDLRLDGFGALMTLLVSGIGILVVAYSGSYFPRHQYALGRLVGLLTLFAGAMLGLVLADNLLALYGFWELTSVTSFFLIGNRHTSAAARAASLQALLITGLGALAMLVGFILLGQQGGTYRLSELLANPPSGPVVTAALVLVLLGAVTKSAQYPFHSWLPGAMVAPTPVSAYLHSATMVKAGVYLVARFTPAFIGVGFWRPAVVTIGAVTMLFGGMRALRQSDLKLMLAMGTVSQLGFMFVLFGLGTPEAVTAGCVLLLAHGLFKAALFMSVGVVDHQLKTRDINELPRIGLAWPGYAVTVVVSAASMAGLPLAMGFIAKEAGYESLLHSGTRWGGLLVAVVVAASALTFAYSARFVQGSLLAGGRSTVESPPPGAAPSPAFLAAPVLLSVLTVFFGLFPALLDGLIEVAATAIEHGAVAVHLAIWHGLNTAFLLTLVTITAGILVFLARPRLAGVAELGSRIPNGSMVYRLSLRSVNRFADLVTGVVQSGSLPVYCGVILASSTLAPMLSLRSMSLGDAMQSSGGPPSLILVTTVIATILIAAAVGTTIVRGRYASALLLAGVGYSMAAMFVVQGAPDLALTQAAVESLFTVLFVLVLRSLPDHFEHRVTLFGQSFRVVVAGVVGIVVFTFAMLAGTSPLPSSVSEEMIELAQPEGHGSNVVNVILVDFRGFDTLGELTVLAAAAIGAVALARAVNRPGRPPSEQSAINSEPLSSEPLSSPRSTS